MAKYKYNCGIDDFVIYDPKNKNLNTRNLMGYMMNRCMQMFQIDGLPDTMPERIVKMKLLQFGNTFITQHEGELYALNGGFGGIPDYNYQPTEYIVANPYLDISKSYNIKDDGVLIRNDSMNMGLLPLISKYASMMVENELTIYDIEILSRAMLVFLADKDNDIPEVKKYIKSLIDGDLVAIGTEKILTKNGTVDVQPGATTSAQIITNLIELQQYLKGSFWNDIGLNANWNAKRANITESETLLNDQALFPLYDDMKECWSKGFKDVNEKYGTNIIVTPSSSWAINEAKNEDKKEDYKEDAEDGGDADVNE